MNIDNIIDRIGYLKEKAKEQLESLQTKNECPRYQSMLQGNINAYEMALHIIFEEMEEGD